MLRRVPIPCGQARVNGEPPPPTAIGPYSLGMSMNGGELEPEDLLTACVVLARLATDNGHRVGLDEVMTRLGFDRYELEAELAADIPAGRD